MSESLYLRAIVACLKTDGLDALNVIEKPREVEYEGRRYIVLSDDVIYRVQNSGQLKRLKRWPADLTTHIEN